MNDSIITAMKSRFWMATTSLLESAVQTEPVLCQFERSFQSRSRTTHSALRTLHPGLANTLTTRKHSTERKNVASQAEHCLEGICTLLANISDFSGVGVLLHQRVDIFFQFLSNFTVGALKTMRITLAIWPGGSVQNSRKGYK